MNRDKEIIIDLIRASSLILEFCENLDYQTFTQDLKTHHLSSIKS